MATGADFQPRRGVALTSITPGIDFRTGEVEAWAEGERVAQKYENAQKPNLLRRAAARGAKEGAAIAAGEMEMPEEGFLSYGEAHEARVAARQTAYLARIRTDIDDRESQARRDYRYDPEAYTAEMERARSTFIQNAPPEYAVEVENYAKDRAQRGLDVVASARVERDAAETNQALAVRVAKLDEDLIAMSAKGVSALDPQFLAVLGERQVLQLQREGNPAILYSTDQRVADDEKLEDGIVLADINRRALDEYRDNGRGLPGFAKASRLLQQEILDDERFADVSPGRRTRLHSDAMRELRAYTAHDTAEQRAMDEQDRERRRAMREAADSAVLDASLGEVTEAQILAREDLDDAGKSRALSALRARVSRERTEDRAVAAEERAGQRAAYELLRDDAVAGGLSEAEIAEALNAGQITPGRAQTLRTLRDRTLSPHVDDVMSVVKDAAARPGASVMPDRNQRLARAEEGAAAWVRENPNATLEQRLQAGRWYADRHFGAGSNRPAATSGGSEAQARAQRVAAANARIRAAAEAGRPMSVREQNRLRSEAQRGTANGD